MVDAVTGARRRSDDLGAHEPPPKTETIHVEVRSLGLMPDFAPVRALYHGASTPLAVRQAIWVEEAKAAGKPEPRAALDPFRAQPEDIANAWDWLQRGGVIPRDELARDGGKAYRESIRDAVVLRLRGFDAMLALHDGQPNEQRALLTRELELHGVNVAANASLDDLRALYVQARTTEEMRAPTMGLDGRTGTKEEVDTYERNEAVDAMNPGTTLGSILATMPVAWTGEIDVEAMRTRGALGEAIEGVGGGVGEPLTRISHEHAPMFVPRPDIDNFNRTGLVPKYAVTPMQAHYVGENVPGNTIWEHGRAAWPPGGPTHLREVKYAERPTDRAPYKLEARAMKIDGKTEMRLFDANGELFDTRQAKTNDGKSAAIFVMNAQGEIFSSTYQEAAYMHHSSLSGGEPVAAAGEIVVEDGRVVAITNQSGHYLPDSKLTDQLITSLRAQGLDLAGVHVTTYRRVGDRVFPTVRVLPQ